MRAVVVTATGGPEVLQVQELPDPVCGPADVRVEVAAAGVNFADVMTRIGLYPDAPPLPCVVGYEIAGTIVEVGSEVDDVEIGQLVCAGTRFGGYAEQVVIPARDAVPMPPGLTPAQATAIPVNYATAWSGLISYAHVAAGDRVLVHAAAGGVGIAAVQLAKRFGAEVWGTASPAKHSVVLGLGADHAIDYTREDWAEGLPTFDIVMDGVGGRTTQTSYDLLRPGGRLVAFGSASVVGGDLKMPRFRVMDMMAQSKTVIGLNVLRLWDEFGTLEPWITPLRELLLEGSIEPLVDEEFPFERAGDAHQLLAERRNVGKVVLVP
jgi:NADPH:quinone reductase-like Zn-dependent oxidoreductase